jgi:hypothetical protein
MLCSECAYSIHELAKTNSLDNSKSCIEIHMRHSWIWPEICLQCELEFAGICRYILSREYSGLEEHIWLLFYREGCHGFLVQPETKLCGLEYHRSRVYIIECVKPCSFIKF